MRSVNIRDRSRNVPVRWPNELTVLAALRQGMHGSGMILMSGSPVYDPPSGALLDVSSKHAALQCVIRMFESFTEPLATGDRRCELE